MGTTWKRVLNMFKTIKKYEITVEQFSVIPSDGGVIHPMVFEKVTSNRVVALGPNSHREFAIILIVDKSNGEVEVIATLTPVARLKSIFNSVVGRAFTEKYGDKVLDHVEVYVHLNRHDRYIYARGLTVAKKRAQAALKDKLISPIERERISARLRRLVALEW